MPRSRPPTGESELTLTRGKLGPTDFIVSIDNGDFDVSL